MSTASSNFTASSTIVDREQALLNHNLDLGDFHAAIRDTLFGGLHKIANRMTCIASSNNNDRAMNIARETACGIRCLSAWIKLLGNTGIWVECPEGAWASPAEVISALPRLARLLPFEPCGGAACVCTGNLRGMIDKILDDVKSISMNFVLQALVGEGRSANARLGSTSYEEAPEEGELVEAPGTTQGEDLCHHGRKGK
jgi:hypothetical protein